MATTWARTAERTASSHHNLPAPLTSLLGRARELAEVGEMLRRTRLVTLTGPGGVGKTRLALELARDHVGRRADGVWLVDLTAGPEAPNVPQRDRPVARPSQCEARRRRPMRSSGYLANRDLLLVLDNCEHVINQCAELAHALLTACPGLRVLATSREPLSVHGETVWSLSSLQPEDAFRLFVERARQRRPDFIPGSDDDATIDGAVRARGSFASRDRACRGAGGRDVSDRDPLEHRDRAR